MAGRNPATERRSPTRRDVLHALGRIGGAGAVLTAMSALGLLRVSPARAGTPSFPVDAGTGKRVIVLGAGLAGLASGLLLAQHGFEVSVIEAADRIGGRRRRRRHRRGPVRHRLPPRHGARHRAAGS